MTRDDEAKRSPEWLNACRPVIDTIADQMMVISGGYEILMVNQAFLDSTGLAPEAVIGRRCHAVTHLSDQPCWANGEACPLERVMESGHGTVVTHVHFDGRGKPRHVEIVGSPARDKSGRVVGLIESLRDVTEEKELRDTLTQRNAELEEARLRRDQHTSAVCHELKNILNSLSLNAQVLRAPGHSPKTQRHAGFIVDEAKRLARLVEDMRDAVAIESQRFSIQRAACDLAELVRRAADECQAVAGERRLLVEIRDASVPGYWDATRVRQVLDNLIANAIKFSEPNTEIRISLERASSKVSVAVTDQGSGIPAENLPRLFQPYARARTQVPGVGLGLFLCRGIVEAHGGQISVSSVEGQGTTVSFWVPES